MEKLVRGIIDNKAYLIINDAAIFLTLGHLMSEMIVSKFPKTPTTRMMIVKTAPSVRRVLENRVNSPSGESGDSKMLSFIPGLLTTLLIG